MYASLQFHTLRTCFIFFPTLKGKPVAATFVLFDLDTLSFFGSLSFFFSLSYLKTLAHPCQTKTQTCPGFSQRKLQAPLP